MDYFGSSDSYEIEEMLEELFSGAMGFGILMLIIAVFAIAMVVALVTYIFTAIGLMRIAKKEGLDSIAWFGFIPVIGFAPFLLGKIAGSIPGKPKTNTWAIVLLVLAIVTGLSGVLTAIPFIGYIIAVLLSFVRIGSAVVSYICYDKIYRELAPNNATVLLILSILFGIITPFVLFALSKRDFPSDEVEAEPIETIEAAEPASQE